MTRRGSFGAVAHLDLISFKNSLTDPVAAEARWGRRQSPLIAGCQMHLVYSVGPSSVHQDIGRDFGSIS